MPDYRLYPFEFGILSPEQKVLLAPFYVGDPPPGSVDNFYEHVQASASDTWVVQHNLFKYPSVAVVDSAGDEVEGSVHYDSNTQLTITFSAPFSGKAYLN